jgi:hypothetical protein
MANARSCAIDFLRQVIYADKAPWYNLLFLVILLVYVQFNFFQSVTKLPRLKQFHKIFFQIYEQDATLYNILYDSQCSTCFKRFLRPSSGAQNCTHDIGYMSSLLAGTARVGEFHLVYVKKFDIYQMLCLLFWAPDDGRGNRLKHVEHWQ